jgi:hypothetical protein
MPQSDASSIHSEPMIELLREPATGGTSREFSNCFQARISRRLPHLMTP